MLHRLAFLLLSLGACQAGGKKTGPAGYHAAEGDILFQSLPNPAGMDLVDAIEGSTGSPYSHCGMVFLEGGAWR